MIQSTLDIDHKPFHLPSNFCGDNHLQDWFRDSPSSTRYCQDLILTQKIGTENIFEKIDDFFFPIDNVPTKETTLPGQDGKIHNFHFCMEMHATFKYRGGEVFNFEGDDDVWVFINNKLALDLGGVHTPQTGSVDLDAQKPILGISTGNYYNFDFFFCERQTIGSHLKMNTSIDIIPPPAPGYYIATPDLNLLVKGDTLSIPQGDGKKILKGVEIKTQSQTIDCSNVTSLVRNAVIGNWTLGGIPIPAGSEIEIDPDLFPVGLHKLYFEKNGSRDSAIIRIQPLSQVATPRADLASQEFSVGMEIQLTTSTAGAIIHYTLDGSTPTEASPIYTLPIRLNLSSQIQAIAIKPGMRKSLVMVETYSKKLTTALKGYYQDLNGDGHIETASLVFDQNFIRPPTQLWFIDPFSPTFIEKKASIIASGNVLKATFAPFVAGTGFVPTDLATIASEVNFFNAQTLNMEDSVGAVLISAKAYATLSGAGHPALEVEFSEPVKMSLLPQNFPFDLKRNGLLIDKETILVDSVRKLSPLRYRLVFKSNSKYPVARDSLRISRDAFLEDERGNKSIMGYFILVSGDPIRAEAEIQIQLEKGVTQSEPGPNLPQSFPILVHSGADCLNCQDPQMKIALPRFLPPNLSALGPTWKVTTQFPFRYSLVFFDNLGQFVNRADGIVTHEQVQKSQILNPSKDSSRVYLTFLPMAEDGHAIGTGAYIMKGTVTLVDQKVYLGNQGEDILLVPTSKAIISRFGFLR